MEGFITEPNDIYLWNIVTYGAHRRHRLLFIICKYRSIFLCVTTGSVALLVYKPFVYFIISLSNKVLLFNRLWAPAITELLLKFTDLETVNFNTCTVAHQGQGLFFFFGSEKIDRSQL